MNPALTQTAPGLTEPLPTAWAERIFMRLHGRFGNQFFDKFRAGKLNSNRDDVGIENAKQVWADELTGYAAHEIKRGLEQHFSYPPSCDEFKTACRPVISSHAEWAEACEQMRIRLRGEQADRWSRPEVYWAAVSIGWYDLNSTAWERIKTRWENALATAKTDPIPEYRAQLPAPGKQSISREEAKERVKSLNVTLGEGKTDYKAWAKRIIANPQNYPHKSLDLAKEALAQEATA